MVRLGFCSARGEVARFPVERVKVRSSFLVIFVFVAGMREGQTNLRTWNELRHLYVICTSNVCRARARGNVEVGFVRPATLLISA